VQSGRLSFAQARKESDIDQSVGINAFFCRSVFGDFASL
jgi:hypothetical protein